MGKKIASGPNSKAARAQLAASNASGTPASTSRKQQHHHFHNTQHSNTTNDAAESSSMLGDPSGGGVGDLGASSPTNTTNNTVSVVSSSTIPQQQQQQHHQQQQQHIIAHIRVQDNFKMLPRYSAALSRPHDEFMLPEDLDAIQMELETLLSTVARRSNALRHETVQLERGYHAGDLAQQQQLAVQSAAGASGSSQTAVGGNRRETKKMKELQQAEKLSAASGKRKRGSAAAATADVSVGIDSKKKDKYYGGQRKVAKSKGGGGSNSPANALLSSAASTSSSSSSAGAAAASSSSHHQQQHQGLHNLHGHHHSQHTNIIDASSMDAIDAGSAASIGHHHHHHHHHHQQQQHGSADNPKVMAMPKNDVPNKFWLSVEPYCMPISHEDIKLLDDLIAEYAGPLVPAIPELGPHYSRTWAHEDLRDEQEASNANAKENRRFTSAVGSVGGGTTGTAAASSATAATDDGGGAGAKCGTAGGGPSEVLGMLRKGEKLMGEQVTGPLTQRLMAAFLEENIINSAGTAANEMAASATPTNPAKGAAADESAVQSAAPALMARNGISLERRVRQELIDQGLLCAEDFAKENSGSGTGADVVVEDDEILNEIMRVRTELATIAEYNYSELQKLRQLATVEMRRLEVKRKLDIVDQEIVEMYKRVALIKQSKQQKRRRLTDAERAEVLRLTEEQKRLSDQLETFNR